jgi:ribosome-binding factor A
MSTNRIDKINSLLEREISQIIRKEVFFPNGVLVTLTSVKATGNLIEAKVYISAFPDGKIDEVLKILNKQIYGIQQQINKKVNMRPVPKIIFVADKTESKAGRVEELLAQLKKEEN